MKSADELSVWDLRTHLLSSVDFAQDFAHNRPEHAAAVTSFSQEIRRIKKELMISFEEGSAPSSLHDIVNGLTSARALASIMAEHHPEKSGPLTEFVEGLKHAQEEFIRKVRPDVEPQA
ncbi:MAG: hypothetical protein ABI988_13110 [Nitrospirota bacterium]